MEFQFRTRECIEIIACDYPCRADLIRRLYVDHNLGRAHPVALPAAIYVYGDHGTGKTAVLGALLGQLQQPPVQHHCCTVDAVECFTPRHLYESCLAALPVPPPPSSSAASPPETGGPFGNLQRRCDSGRDFVDALRTLPADRAYVLRIDDAHRLRDLDAGVLAVLLRLRELSGRNVCCVLVGTLPFEKLLPVGSFPAPVLMHWRNYAQRDVLEILLANYPVYSKRLQERFVHAAAAATTTTIEAAEKQRRADVIDGLERGFYESFLALFLSTFFRTCRDLNELRLVSEQCFLKYCEPILLQDVSPTDVRTLYKNVASTLRAATNQIYRRIDRGLQTPANASTTADATLRDPHAPQQPQHHQLELPYYAKYLLIAAFLASHNDVKLDRRLFVKHHGKQRKTQHTINARQIVSEKMATQLGPKSFPIDRLLAIFYAICEERVPLTCNLLAQIPSLVRLRLLSFASGEANVMDGGAARLQCVVGLEFVLQIGRNVGFNVRQYLGDFM